MASESVRNSTSTKTKQPQRLGDEQKLRGTMSDEDRRALDALSRQIAGEGDLKQLLDPANEVSEQSLYDAPLRAPTHFTTEPKAATVNEGGYLTPRVTRQVMRELNIPVELSQDEYMKNIEELFRTAVPR